MQLNGTSPLMEDSSLRSGAELLKYRLRGLLVFVAVVAGGLVILRQASTLLRGNYDQFSRRISTVEGIHDVHVWGDDEEGMRDVELLIFRIDGKPGSYVEILNPATDIFDDTDSIRLRQIGNMQLSVSYADSHRQHGMTADIGPDSELKSILPLTVRNLSDLIANYDELAACFAKWPVYPDIGKLEISQNRTIEYHSDVVTEHQFNVPSTPQVPSAR